MTVYIYSTATSGNDYTFYEKGGAEMPKAVKTITINGGANLANKNLITPLGVATPVSDEDFKLLLTSRHFQQHVDAGFMKYDKRRMNPEKVVPDMESRDASAPIVPQDYPEGTQGPVPQIVDEDEEEADDADPVEEKKAAATQPKTQAKNNGKGKGSSGKK